MKNALRVTIQAAWICVGAYACWLTGSLLWSVFWQVFGGHFFQNGALWLLFPTCALILGLGLLGALIYGAWTALFRFSAKILGPTCLIVGLILFHAANNAAQDYTKAFLNPRLGMHPLAPFLGLALTITVFAGWITFCRIMPRILARVLFPDLSAAARTLI